MLDKTRPSFLTFNPSSINSAHILSFVIPSKPTSTSLIFLLLLVIPSNTHFIKLPLTTTYSQTAKDALASTTSSHKESLSGNAGLGYCVQMLIGTPAQQLSILIDTGSSNFAIASLPHPFIHKFFNTSLSSTFKTHHRSMHVFYTQGDWTGYVGKELVSLRDSDTTVRTEVSFISASTSFFLPFSDWQGIWGLGYAEIAMAADGSGGQDSLWEGLVEEEGIEDTFSLVMCGSYGYMTLGGVDEGDIEGDLHFVSLRKEWYYEVVLVDVLVGAVALDIDCKEYNFNKAIIDSGTTNLHFPPTVFHAIIAVLQKAVKVMLIGCWL